MSVHYSNKITKRRVCDGCGLYFAFKDLKKKIFRNIFMSFCTPCNEKWIQEDMAYKAKLSHHVHSY